MGHSNNLDIYHNGFVPPDLHFPPSSIPLKPIETRYLLIRALGHGSFGTVTLAKAQFDLKCLSKDVNTNLTLMYQDKSLPQNKITKYQKLVAIKTMVTRLKTLHEYKKVREVKFIMRMAPSAHLIQIFEIFIDNTNFQLHIVMEYMEQNLYQMMKHRKHKPFSYPSLKSILAQLLAGIKHIHSYNFFHRDIKPENILVTPSQMYYEKDEKYTDSYVIKLADFGLARDIYNKKTYTPYVSTRWYRSPEILLRNGYYSTPLDIWAFGCVAFEMVNFQPLFPGNDELDQVWKILKILGTPYKSPEFSHINSSPSGGFWKDSLILINKLNLKLPFVEGIDITTLLANPRLKDLSEVIINCLRWDPNQRASATELAKFKYFHNTIIQKESENGSKTISDMQQAMLFAGINPTQFNAINQKLKINGEEEELEKMIQKPIKRQCISRSSPNIISKSYSNQYENSENVGVAKQLDDRLTVKEFLHDYQRESVQNNTIFIPEEVPSFQFGDSNNDFAPDTNDNHTGLEMALDEFYESECDDGFENDMDIVIDNQADIEEDENDDELSKEIERNLKNCYIPREVPDEIISSSVKDTFYDCNTGNKTNLQNYNSGNINVTINQDMLKDFSESFSMSINLQKGRFHSPDHTQQTNLKGSSSYMLSNNIQQEIQPKHNNLLDSSFESSLNFTPRKFLPETQVGEPFFDVNPNEMVNNLQTLPQRSPRKRTSTQILGNITF